MLSTTRPALAAGLFLLPTRLNNPALPVAAVAQGGLIFTPMVPNFSFRAFEVSAARSGLGAADSLQRAIVVPFGTCVPHITSVPQEKA